MKAKELILKNNGDNLRFYKKSDSENIYIDEYTPYIEKNEILNSELKELEVDYFCIDGEYCCNEIIDEWIIVVLKEEEK